MYGEGERERENHVFVELECSALKLSKIAEPHLNSLKGHTDVPTHLVCLYSKPNSKEIKKQK